MRNRHTSPFEMVELLFHIKLPIFVMRQHVRHRTASLNEYSARYSVLSDEFYFPGYDRELGQSQVNKQKSSGFLTDSQVSEFMEFLDESYSVSYNNYKKSLDMGISREVSRAQLPVANYTEIYWKIDLHNFFHYNGLRDDPGHAQTEIVELAKLMYEMVKVHVPISCKAFEDYRKNSVSFSAQETKLLSNLINYHLFTDEDKMKSLENQFSEYLSAKEIIEFRNKIISLFE